MTVSCPSCGQPFATQRQLSGHAVHKEWADSFETFLLHIGPAPSKAYTIDRIDNDRGYEPGNVRWATRTQQNQNTRANRNLTAFGETLPITVWGRRTGIHRHSISLALRRGKTPEEIFSSGRQPVANTKLSYADALYILANGTDAASYAQLAARFGVDVRTIRRVAKGLSHKTAYAHHHASR